MGEIILLVVRRGPVASVCITLSKYWMNNEDGNVDHQMNLKDNIGGVVDHKRLNVVIYFDI